MGEEQNAVVYWIDENKCSVVSSKNIVNESQKQEGVVAEVLWGKKPYQAKILFMGSAEECKSLEKTLIDQLKQKQGEKSEVLKKAEAIAVQLSVQFPKPRQAINNQNSKNEKAHLSKVRKDQDLVNKDFCQQIIQQTFKAPENNYIPPATNTGNNLPYYDCYSARPTFQNVDTIGQTVQYGPVASVGAFLTRSSTFVAKEKPSSTEKKSLVEVGLGTILKDAANTLNLEGDFGPLSYDGVYNHDENDFSIVDDTCNNCISLYEEINNLKEEIKHLRGNSSHRNEGSSENVEFLRNLANKLETESPVWDLNAAQLSGLGGTLSSRVWSQESAVGRDVIISKVELYPGTGVFITKAEKSLLHLKCTPAKKITSCLEYLYTHDQLAKMCAIGGENKCGLSKNELAAIKGFIVSTTPKSPPNSTGTPKVVGTKKRKRRELIFPRDLTDSYINGIINKKCANIRRDEKRIKGRKEKPAVPESTKSGESTTKSGESTTKSGEPTTKPGEPTTSNVHKA